MINGFGKGLPKYGNDFSEVIVPDDEELVTGIKFLDYECDNPNCCENWVKKPFFNGLMNTGFFMFGSTYIGLGTFLANFANLTAEELWSIGIGIGIRHWSTFDLNHKISATNYQEYCDKISDTDEFLHKYFKGNKILLC